MPINSDQRKPTKTRSDSGQVKRDGAGRLQPGSKLAWRHGLYSPAFEPEELRERAAFEAELISDLGGDLPAGKRALISVIGFQFLLIRRCDRAVSGGVMPPAFEHLLALTNSFRLNLVSLGLERKARPTPTLQQYMAAWERERAAAAEVSQPAGESAAEAPAGEAEAGE